MLKLVPAYTTVYAELIPPWKRMSGLSAVLPFQRNFHEYIAKLLLIASASLLRFLQLVPMKAYTRVLQGHIGLATSTFPDGTPGFMIDAFARRHLWEAGLDYQHGTGHGVGAALNVHEGPHVSLICLA